jgi:gluconolactonase
MLHRLVPVPSMRAQRACLSVGTPVAALLSMNAESSIDLLIRGYDSPEGPAFDRAGNLFFVNWLTSSIVRLAPDGTAEEWFNTGGIPAGLAFHPDGSLYVADEGDAIHGVLRLSPERQLSVVVDRYQGQPLNGANDLFFDRHGTLYFSDPWGSSLEKPIGGFYRLFPDGRLEQLDTGLAFPNGVAVAPDGTAVYLAETWHNRVLRYAIGPDNRVGPREDWAYLEGEPGPDGMAFDADGFLYVAHFGGGRVDVVAPDGSLAGAIKVPGRQPTNVAFGGPDRRTLVITEVETGALYQARMRVPGHPLLGDADR